jgi:hypothetical protein
MDQNAQFCLPSEGAYVRCCDPCEKEYLGFESLNSGNSDESISTSSIQVQSRRPSIGIFWLIR